MTTPTAPQKRRRGERVRISDPRVEPELRRCLGVLRTVFRVLGIPIREIERRLGVSHSYWNQILSEKIGLSFKLLLGLAYTLEIEPAELFRLLLPGPPAPSPAARRLTGAIADLTSTRAEGLVLHPSSSQATRWARCSDVCGFCSVEEWLAAAADAEVLRQQAELIATRQPAEGDGGSGPKTAS